jgi:hypothetical protein
VTRERLVGSKSLLLRGAAAVPLIDSVVGGGLDADVRTPATGRAAARVPIVGLLLYPVELAFVVLVGNLPLLVAVVAVAVILTRSPRARRALRPAVRAARGLFHVEITSGAVDVGTVELDLPVREVVALGVRTGPPVGGVDLSHSAWQPCHRQRPSAILNLEGDAMCNLPPLSGRSPPLAAPRQHRLRKVRLPALAAAPIPSATGPAVPAISATPLGVTFMRPPGVSWS